MHTLLDAAQGFAFGEALYPLGGTFGPLVNRYVCLLMMHEGAATITCDGVATVVQEGQCGIFYNERFYKVEYEPGRRDRVGWCEASPASLPEAVALRLRSAPNIIAISERLATLQRFGVELRSESGNNLNMLRNSLGQSLFMAFFHEAHASEQELRNPRTVMLTKQYMDDNFEKDINIEELADVASITPQHLISLFRRHVGMTPIRYLWKKRAERGHFLLLHTGLTVSEIAYQCGYKNPFHFSRHIKQCFQIPPRDVRLSSGYRVPAELVEQANAEDARELVASEGRETWIGQVESGRRSKIFSSKT